MKNREKTDKRFYKFRVMYAAALLCFSFIMPVQAKENTEIQGSEETESITNIQGNIMMTLENTEGRIEPKKNAAVIIRIPEGTFIFVMGDEEDGWYESLYQGKTMYVLSEKLKETDMTDNPALKQEMEKAGEEDIAFIESLEQQRRAIARTKMWRLIIIILIAAIFLAGGVSALREARKNTGDKKNG